jgi:hypothetical protein
MVKRVQCRVVQSESLSSRSLYAEAEPTEVGGPAGGDADIAKILGLIYNIKCSWLRKQLTNRKATPGLVIDFLA